MGYTLEHGDADALARVVLHAYEHREQLVYMGENARTFCLEEASRKKQTLKYYQILTNMSNLDG
jgi:hypothetical protein